MTDPTKPESQPMSEAELGGIEAGFIDRLDYLLKSVRLPQTLTTNGRTIVISTPPDSPAHEPSATTVGAATAYGFRLEKKTPAVGERQAYEAR